MGKTGSKRVTLHQKYKIQKKVKEHKRKLKKAQKKNGINGSALWRSKQEANIPNDWPFKDQMLAEIERQRLKEKEIQEKNKELRKKQQAEKKKKEALEGKKPVESMLPVGMGSPAPVPFAQSNAIQLDAYTRRVWREIKQTVEESDLILEVLDARDPLGSRCFEIEQWISGKLLEKQEKKASAKKGASADGEAAASKPVILVLNKCDLIPATITQKWLDFFGAHDHFPCIAFYGNKELEKSDKKGQVVSPKDLCQGTEALLQLIANFQSSADEGKEEGARKPIKVGVIGFGNVGKSSVINNLARTHATGVGAVPGYTKEILRVKLGKGLYAIDTPAVPTKEDAPGPHTALPISNNRIEEDVSRFIEHFEMDNLLQVLSLKPVETLEEFLDGLAQRVGKQLKGGEFNRVAGARKLLKDWNEGKLMYFTQPPTIEEPEEQPATGPIQEFFLSANKRTVAELRKRSDLPKDSKCLAVNGSLFDEGDDDDEDGEDDDDEEVDEEGDVEMGSDEEMEEMEDEDEEEEEEELPPPPPSKKKGNAAAPTKPQPKAQAKAPAPQQPTSKKASPPAPVAASASKKKTAPAPVAPAPVSQAKQSKKRAREESEDEDEEEEQHQRPSPSKPAAKKQAQAPKGNSTKPTAKPAPPQPAQAQSKKKQGKK